MNRKSVLIVDDEHTIRLSLKLLFERSGFDVCCASSGEEAVSLLRTGNFSIVISDMNYSGRTDGEEGIELLRRIKVLQPSVPVILITAWGSIGLAVEGMRRGAFDFITKPFSNATLMQSVETALALNVDYDGSENQTEKTSTFDRAGIIGHNRELENLLSIVERVAPTDASVLILGENGTGKELIANAIHRNSRRHAGPFVKVNLGGIATSLFESEMFGHTKGAYTGAVAARKGSFELADGGTIFLDEIGDLDAQSQVKLLRVLQEHTYQALGDSRSRTTDIRVICATNADLFSMVREKTFREDLLYRINLITLRMPSLRERRDDIPLLVRHFLHQCAERHRVPVPEISADTMEWLTRLPYPGNIRELKNMVERAVLMGGTMLEKTDFPYVEPTAVSDFLPSVPTLDEMERFAIVEALEKAGGNLAGASRMLGITRQSLYRRMDKFGLKANQ